MDSVNEFLKTLNINKNDTLIVAVSFGPDSMALLNIIKRVYPNNKIVCAHVHHNHRKESDIECDELRKYCVKSKIDFEFMKIESYKNDMFTEEEARSKRYSFFDSLIKKYGSNYLFTAHHGDDLVETVLMRIIRGSSLKGYAGIPLISKRKSYNLIRPFLFVTKDDILSYCNENNISYAVDKSNSDDSYTRNRYRKYVLPCLKQENPLVHKQFLKFSTVLNEYDNYFEKVIDKLYPSVITQNEINVSELLKQDDLIIKRLIMRYLYDNYKEEITYVESDNIDLVLSLVKSKKTCSEISLPRKKTLIKSYNKIYFDNGFKYNDYCFVFDGYEKLPNDFIINKIGNLENTTNYVTAFNSQDISFPLYIRNVINGDKIEVLGLNGSKKVHDIFITEKIPKRFREVYPLLVDSEGKILWIPGVKKSKYDKSKQGKYDIILKYYKEEKNDRTK